MNNSEDPNSSYSTVVQLALIALAAFSSLISLLIPALYHIKKQCRQHPTNLITLSNYNIILIAVNIYKFQKFVDIRNIFDLITFNQTEEPSDTDFCQINYGLYMILELSSIAYNIAFSIDLFVTLKFPFFAGKKRIKFYDIFAVLFLFSTMPQAIAQAYDICENQYHNKAIYKVPMIFIVVLGIFYVLSLAIIFFSFLQTKKLGKVRAHYIRHHRIILIILMSAWLFPIWTNILIYFGDQNSDQFYIVNLISFVSLLMLGASVNIVRFYHDKYVWEQVKRMITFKRTVKINKNKDDSKKKIESDIWNLPLAAAVAQLNNQKVIHSLIQVVAHACSEQQINKITRQNNERSQRSKSIMTFTMKEKKFLQKMSENDSFLNNKKDLLEKFIQRNIENASISELKKICKRSKKFNMFCLNNNNDKVHQSAHLTLKQKTVFAQLKKSKRVPTLQINQSVSSRGRSDFKNHYSLNNEKDLLKLRNQFLINENSKSIDMSKEQFNFLSQFDVLKSNKSNSEIKVTSHAHELFSSIRKLAGLTEEDVLDSLDLQKNVNSILKAKESLGASGSFFFFSFDHKLIIKTIGEGQDEILLQLLPKYYFHLKKYKDTLLSKIYGLFTVEIAGISKITFILMENSFHRMEIQNIVYKKYDLKGSTVSRQVRNPQADVLKDINYLKSNDAFIMMDPQQRQKLISQIQADIRLLRNQNIMDYSLLLGVGVRSKPKPNNLQNEKKNDLEKTKLQDQRENQIDFQKQILKRKKHDFDTMMNLAPQRRKTQQKVYQKSWKYIDEYEQTSGRIYSISLIDYLQQFNFNKYMELQLKKLFKGGGDISSVDSEYYFYRFLKFIKKIIVPVKNFKPKQNQSKKQIKQNNSRQSEIKQKNKVIYQIKLGDQWEDLYLQSN